MARLNPALSITLLAFLGLFVASTASLPIDLFEVPQWVHDNMPKKGLSIHSEIHCYALPYGAIGNVSHVLTYYTIGMLACGRSPFAPCRKLNSPRIDICLGLLALLASVFIAVVMMMRCKQRWQFFLIALWKAMLSIALGGSTIHAAIITLRSKDKTTTTDHIMVLWWLLVYAIGIIIGLTGLISLVIKSWGMYIVVLSSEIFGAVVVGLTFLALVFQNCCQKDLLMYWFWYFLLVWGCLPALYSDWVLAGLADSLIGVPSGDNSLLYFAYFVAKRIPFFSF